MRFWFDIAQLAGTLAIGAYVWWDRRKKANDKRFTVLEQTVSSHAALLELLGGTKARRDANCEKHQRRITDLGNKQVVLESDIRHLPSRKDMADLLDKIGALTEKLGTLDGRLTGINRAVDLLNQHHLRVD
jgi:chromosome segregation ATPase